MGVPRLTFWDHPLTAVLSIRRAVHLRRDRPAHRQARALPGSAAESRCTTAGFGSRRGGACCLALSIALLNGVVVTRRDETTSTRPSPRSTTRPIPTFPAPTSQLRSGGPESLVSWESLGHQGRVFVSAARRSSELSKFNGKPAIEPIRAYAGLHSADGIKATAALAAQELQRTGGLDREVVAVATTTGTGWINEAEASALEYMYNGNTAIVQHAVLVPAELAVVPRRQGERPTGRSGAVRGRRRVGPRDARGAAAQAGGVRREPGLVRRRGAVPVAEQPHRPHRRRPVLRSDVQQHDLGRPHPQPRQGLARVAADLRQRRERPLRRATRQPRPPGRSVGRAAGGVPAARVGPDRLVEPRSAVRRAGLAARAPRLRPVTDGCSGSRS